MSRRTPAARARLASPTGHSAVQCVLMTIGWKRSSLAVAGILAAVVGMLLAANPAPTVPAIRSDTGVGRQPYVVKLHARWCPLCMVTKDVWSEVDAAYAGKVRLVVFDFTTDATTETTRQRAKA